MLASTIGADLLNANESKAPAKYKELKDDHELFDPAKGPGLDSIDVLELVVNLEREFGVIIPDRETGRRVLRSVDTIVEFITTSGKK